MLNLKQHLLARLMEDYAASDEGCRGLVIWDATPPAGVTHSTHYLTLHLAVEKATTFLGTKPFEREDLRVGASWRELIAIQPRFSRFLAGPVKLGVRFIIGVFDGRRVLVDPTLLANEARLVCGRTNVRLILQSYI